MDKTTRFEVNLRTNLQAAIGGCETSRQLNELILLCHRLALVCLRRKKSRGIYREDILGISIEDAGYDCIAELFHRDESGAILQLRAYFAGMNIDHTGDEQLLAHLRRLVFAKVEEGLARMYHEADPILSRILRNLKLAIVSLKMFEEVDRFGELYIVPCFSQPLDQLPICTFEQLENMLCGIVRPGANAPSILASLARILNDQENSARIVPLQLVALAIRSILARHERNALPEYHMPIALNDHDVEQAIRDAIGLLHARLTQEYVGRNKLSPERLTTYLNVVEQHLRHKLVMNDGHDSSLFNLFKKEYPDTTANEFRNEHRAKLEYFLKLAHDRVVEILKQ